MQYQVPTNIKTFFCDDCKREVPVLRWKEISETINKGSRLKCDECWEKFDKEFESYILSKKINNL